MGSFQSSHAGGRPPSDEGASEVTRTVVGSTDAVVDESCAIGGNKSDGPAISYETADRRATPVQEEPEEFESCDGGDRRLSAELAEFREELGRKRELRKSKMADIKSEMEHLRQSLAEERRKNRALIRHIRERGSSELCAAATADADNGGGDEAAVGSVSSASRASSAERVANSRDDIGIVLGFTDATISSSTPPLEQNTDATHTTAADDDARRALKKDLAESQLQLQQATGEILSLQSTLDQLRAEIGALRTPSEQEEAAREQRNREIRQLKVELTESQFQLQIANAEVLSMQTDISQLKSQIKGLKDVIKAGKEIITIREDQVEQLKAKLRQIEDSLAEREMQIMSADLRREYERQMANIRNLRELYEERERVSRMERDNLLRQLELRKNDLDAELEKNKNHESHVTSLQTDLDATKTELIQTKEKLCHSEAESKQLQAEMTVVNRFISKFLLGMSPKQATSSVKLDKLAEVLEENRGLLIEMTKEEAETIDLGSFLPRALYDLVTEVDQQQETTGPDNGRNATVDSSEDDLASGGEFTEVQNASPEQIADKLPKVWRVLIELVNHQERAEQVPFVENGESEDCLKSEQTRNGKTKMVVSVSKTYLKLKDLILEKKSLKKETNRLKTLNTHLERRLETQEKRLSAVSLELTKTWHLVGKMQRQHRQLHTQEQILRYHLQQKRRLLSELKEELEYCRMKWSAARQKNNESEDQWRLLKADFAARKKQDSLNNSGESGYSDEQPTSDEEEEVDNGRKMNQAKEFSSRIVGFERFRSASMIADIPLLVMIEMRKSRSESDMKSLSNVERANQFCNEKIEDLPLFPEEEEELACAIKKKVKKGKKKKDKKTGPETAEEMFMRLAGLKQDTDEEEEDDEETDEELPDDSECSEIEKIDQRGSSPVQESPKEPELSSEEVFNLKREARLKRMAELNSQLDSYSNPSSSKDSGSGTTENDVPEAGSSKVLTSNEEDYLLRRAARLERLEREAKEFRNKLSKTVNRGTDLSAQIDDIHNGFIARQSESPVPGSSSEQNQMTSTASGIPSEDQSVLTERERDYTQSRSDRLQQLENQSQSLINQMNRTLKRGSRLTTQLDMLHSRFSSIEQRNEPEVETSTPGSVAAMTSQEVEPEVIPQTATIDSVLLENSIVIPADGPVELILVSDEEILEEVDELLPTPSNATSTAHEEENDGQFPNEHQDE